MFNRIVSSIGEHLNPVFIKEMRQYFQNRRMIIFMGVLLLAQFICTLFFSSAMAFDADDSSGVGFFLLIVFAGAILSVIICAVGAEQRFAEERSDKELNYAMLTTLKPSSIIWGKLEGAFVMLLCIFSMLLPFLTAAYFMRGLSAASLLITLCLLPILLLYSLAGIFAGSFGLKWISGLYIACIFGSCFFLAVPAFEIIDDLMDRGDLGSFFWVAVLVEYKLAFLLGTLLFLLALAVISPPKSNRFCAAKVYLFALPAIALLLMAPYCIAVRGSTSYPPEMFYTIEFLFCVFSFGVMTLVAVCEPPVNSIRVYMKCPRGFPGRFLHFLFSSGSAGTLLLTFPILAFAAALIPFAKLSRSDIVIFCGLISILVSFLGYAILALVLGRRTRIPPLGWLFMFEILTNIIVWIPFVAVSTSLRSVPRPLRIASMVFSHIYCLIETFDVPSRSNDTFYALGFSLCVTGALFLVLLPDIIKTFRGHRYPEIEVKPPTKEMLGK